MLRKLIALLLLALPLSAAIEGDYTVKGYDPILKRGYNGTATITKDKDDVYQMVWMIEGIRYTGTGILTYDHASFISSGPVLEGHEPEIALSVYAIEGHMLKGPWVRLYATETGTEELTKVE